MLSNKRKDSQRSINATPPFTWTAAQVDDLRAASARDDAEALATLATLYRDGVAGRAGTWIVRRSARAERTCLERAAKLGDASAMSELADMLVDKQDLGASTFRRAMRLYRRAFAGGYAVAAFNLARTYQACGRYRDAVRWFRTASAAGVEGAALEVARAELLGMGTRRDISAALQKLRATAQSSVRYYPAESGDNVEAMLLIAETYTSGWLVRRDVREARRWLRLAAKRGSLVAKGLLQNSETPVYYFQVDMAPAHPRRKRSRRPRAARDEP